MNNFLTNNNNVNVISETIIDGSKSLLIGINGGLNIVHLDGEGKAAFRFRHYDEEDGLSGDVIHGIVEDDNGMIWLSTNKGLSQFDPIEIKFKNYDNNDGLSDTEFFPRSFLKNQRGELYFGGLNG